MIPSAGGGDEVGSRGHSSWERNRHPSLVSQTPARPQRCLRDKPSAECAGGGESSVRKTSPYHKSAHFIPLGLFLGLKEEPDLDANGRN